MESYHPADDDKEWMRESVRRLTVYPPCPTSRTVSATVGDTHPFVYRCDGASDRPFRVLLMDLQTAAARRGRPRTDSYAIGYLTDAPSHETESHKKLPVAIRYSAGANVISYLKTLAPLRITQSITDPMFMVIDIHRYSLVDCRTPEGTGVSGHIRMVVIHQLHIVAQCTSKEWTRLVTPARVATPHAPVVTRRISMTTVTSSAVSLSSSGPSTASVSKPLRLVIPTAARASTATASTATASAATASTATASTATASTATSYTATSHSATSTSSSLSLTITETSTSTVTGRSDDEHAKEVKTQMEDHKNAIDDDDSDDDSKEDIEKRANGITNWKDAETFFYPERVPDPVFSSSLQASIEAARCDDSTEKKNRHRGSAAIDRSNPVYTCHGFNVSRMGWKLHARLVDIRMNPSKNGFNVMNPRNTPFLSMTWIDTDSQRLEITTWDADPEWWSRVSGLRIGECYLLHCTRKCPQFSIDAHCYRQTTYPDWIRTVTWTVAHESVQRQIPIDQFGTVGRLRTLVEEECERHYYSHNVIEKKAATSTWISPSEYRTVFVCVSSNRIRRFDKTASTTTAAAASHTASTSKSTSSAVPNIRTPSLPFRVASTTAALAALDNEHADLESGFDPEEDAEEKKREAAAAKRRFTRDKNVEKLRHCTQNMVVFDEDLTTLEMEIRCREPSALREDDHQPLLERYCFQIPLASLEPFDILVCVNVHASYYGGRCRLVATPRTRFYSMTKTPEIASHWRYKQMNAVRRAFLAQFERNLERWSLLRPVQYRHPEWFKPSISDLIHSLVIHEPGTVLSDHVRKVCQQTRPSIRTVSELKTISSMTFRNLATVKPPKTAYEASREPSIYSFCLASVLETDTRNFVGSGNLPWTKSCSSMAYECMYADIRTPTAANSEKKVDCLCGHQYRIPKLRYNLSMLLADHTGSCSATAFDACATTVMGGFGAGDVERRMQKSDTLFATTLMMLLYARSGHRFCFFIESKPQVFQGISRIQHVAHHAWILTPDEELMILTYLTKQSQTNATDHVDTLQSTMLKGYNEMLERLTLDGS